MGRIFLAGSALLLVSLVLGLMVNVYGAAVPPSIDDLDGSSWHLTFKGKAYDLAGSSTSFSGSLDWTITKTGPDTVSFDSTYGGMAYDAWYVDGFLLQAVASAQTPPEDGSSFHVAVSGKPGKMKMKGMLIVYSAGPGYNVLRVLKVSGKQTE